MVPQRTRRKRLERPKLPEDGSGGWWVPCPFYRLAAGAALRGTLRPAARSILMSQSLDPEEIFKRSADEGRRRLDQGLLALVATGFIAGFSIVFGIAAQAVVHSLAEPYFGGFAVVLGALACSTSCSWSWAAPNCSARISSIR